MLRPLKQLSISEQFRDFASGVISFASVGYFLAIVAVDALPEHGAHRPPPLARRSRGKHDGRPLPGPVRAPWRWWSFA